MRKKSSSGDRKGIRCRYLMAAFWLDISNHWWRKYNNEELNERMNARIVIPARREIEKKNKI